MTGNHNSAEDKLLLSRAYDAIELSERRGIPRFLGFLNEHESLFLRQNISLSRDICFFGGYADAARLMLGAGAREDQFPIAALEIRYKPEYELRHRDFLGSLMGLGLNRDAVGDILPGEGRTVIFVRDEIASFILSQLDRIGRVGVKIAYADIADLPDPEETQELVFSLSSLRLDAFVAAACHLSRERTARLIKSEMVMLDHITVTDVSVNLKEGASVTVRKYGKFVLTDLLGASRKGKLRVSVKHFR